MPFRFVYTSLSQTIVNTANCKSKCDPAASGAACSVVESALFHGNAAWNLQHAATAAAEASDRGRTRSLAETVTMGLDVEGVVPAVGLARTSFDTGTFTIVAVAAAAVADGVVLVLAAVLDLARISSPVEEVSSDETNSDDDAERNKDNNIPAVTGSSRNDRSSVGFGSAVALLLAIALLLIGVSTLRLV